MLRILQTIERLKQSRRDAQRMLQGGGIGGRRHDEQRREYAVVGQAVKHIEGRGRVGHVHPRTPAPPAEPRRHHPAVIGLTAGAGPSVPKSANCCAATSERRGQGNVVGRTELTWPSEFSRSARRCSAGIHCR